MWQHCKYSMKIYQQALHNDLTSLLTWQNLNVLSLIGQMGLNDDDSHPNVSSNLLIEDQPPNPKAMAKFCIFILSLFDRKHILGCFDQAFWISQSLNIFFSFSRLIFVSEQCLKSRFYQENRKNSLLEFQFFVFQNA